VLHLVVIPARLANFRRPVTMGQVEKGRLLSVRLLDRAEAYIESKDVATDAIL
jgi:hypothetical protein